MRSKIYYLGDLYLIGYDHSSFEQARRVDSEYVTALVILNGFPTQTGNIWPNPIHIPNQLIDLGHSYEGWFPDESPKYWIFDHRHPIYTTGQLFCLEIVKKRKNVFVNLKKIMKTTIFIQRRRKRRITRKAQMNGQKMIIIYWLNF